MGGKLRELITQKSSDSLSNTHPLFQKLSHLNICESETWFKVEIYFWIFLQCILKEPSRSVISSSRLLFHLREFPWETILSFAAVPLEDLERKFIDFRLCRLRIGIKTLPEAQRTQALLLYSWIIFPATKQANSVERKIQVKHSIGSNFGQMTLPVLVLNLPTRWRYLKIQIEHSIGSNFGH